MKKTLLVLLIATLAPDTDAQSVNLLIKQADSLEAALNETAAYNKFREALRTDPGNYYSLWKCSELCSRIGFRQPTKEKKADYYNAGRIYAETAIKVKPDAADGYYALSLAMGRRAQMESGNDRIKAVRQIKNNAEKALKINPDHGRAWHVLGKWHYEVSNLNGVEKAALKIFYGGLPKASLKQAIAAYEKSIAFEPVFALNNLELAKACYKDGQKERAIALLKAIPAMPAKTEDDNHIKTEGKTLLNKWTK
jgi:tetratricopeptide (TPR) repeat protein